jgi:hypothetical protein
MCSAAANISLKRLRNFGSVGIRISLEQCDAAHDHSRSAVSALERALIDECLLHGMQLPVLLESFNGQDRFVRGIAHGKLAGSPRRATKKDRAGAALAFATTIFAPSQAQLFAKNVEKRSARVRSDVVVLTVDFEVKRFCHLVPALELTASRVKKLSLALFGAPEFSEQK